MSKSLGQVAFEALWQDCHQWPGRPWDDVGPSVREAWQAAAEAVKATETPQEVAYRNTMNRLYKRRSAVIEAAEALVGAMTGDEPVAISTMFADAIAAVMAAVLALQEARDE